MTRTAIPTERHRLRALTALVLGVLHAAAFSPPLGAWWVQSLTMAALLALALPGDATRRPAGLMILWAAFGLGNFTAGLAWLHTSMHVFGGMHTVLAAAALLLFAGYLTLFPVLALRAADAVLRRLHADARTPPAWALALTVGGAWGLTELLRGWALTGFPWLSIGYAHVDGPLAGLAAWVGVYGIGAAAAALAAALGGCADALLAKGVRTPNLRAALPALGACILGLGAAGLLGQMEHTQTVGEPLRVRLVQGNVPQQMKFDRTRILQTMEDYTRMVESSPARLTILPETAWTVPWSYTPAPIAQRLLAHARTTSSAIAIGMPLTAAADGGARGYTNSVHLLRADETGESTGRYDKRHLVPFGEFVPTGFRWFVDLMHIPLGDFRRGAAVQPPIDIDGQRVAFNICYEDLFGAELLPAIRLAAGATVLANVSNIAWFGDSHALPQHLAIGRMRARETGRPMLRATNTGVTAVIDHRGQVREALPVHAHGVLDARVQGTTGLTPYASTGDLAAALPCALALVVAALAGMRRTRRKR